MGTITFNTTVSNAPRIWFCPASGTNVSRLVSGAPLFPPTTAAVGDSVCFASNDMNSKYSTCKYNKLTLKISTPLAASSVTGVWEYACRTTGLYVWKPLSIISDGTNGLTVAGTNTVSFAPPTDWHNNIRPFTADSTEYYQFFIRYRIISISGQTSGGVLNTSSDAVTTTKYSIDVRDFTEASPCTFTDIYNASVAGGWGVVSKNGSQFSFDASLYIPQSTNCIITKNEQIMFGNGFVFANIGILKVGTLINGDIVANGSVFTFESSQCDYSANFLCSNFVSSFFYNAQFKHIGVGGQGTWGKGSNAKSIDVYYEGFRQLTFSDDLAAVMTDIKGRIGENGGYCVVERPGSIMKNISIAGGPYCIRNYFLSKVHIHQCDYGGATSAPVQMYQADTYATGFEHNNVDCKYGAFYSQNRAIWAISSTPVSPNTIHKVWETYSFLAKITDAIGSAIESASATLINADGSVNFNYTTNPDGYIGQENGTATSGDLTSITDTSKSWATDQHFYHEFYLTSGTGKDQRRIIKKGNTATMLPAHVNFVTAPDATTKYIIIPYVRVQALSPAALTPSTSQWSVVSVENNPFTLVLRKYGKNFQTISMTIKDPVVSSYVMTTNPFVSANESTAGAYTGIAISGVGKTITITEAHTLQEIYDYSQWWACQADNRAYDEPIITYDGTNFTLAADWDIIIDVATVSALGRKLAASGTGTYSLINGGDFTGILATTTDTRVPIVVNGIAQGSRLQLYDLTTSTEIFNAVVNATSTISYFTHTGTDHDIRMRLMYVDGVTAKKWHAQTGTVTATGLTFNAVQVDDPVYNAVNIDGSLVTECSISGSVIRIYIDDPDNTTQAQRIYNWYMYYLSTQSGIAEQNGDYITATDATHFRFDNSMKIVNQNTSAPLEITGANVTPVSGSAGSIFDVSNGASIILNFNRVEGFAFSSGSGLSTDEHNQLMSYIPTKTDLATAISPVAKTTNLSGLATQSNLADAIAPVAKTTDLTGIPTLDEMIARIQAEGIGDLTASDVITAMIAAGLGSLKADERNRIMTELATKNDVIALS